MSNIPQPDDMVRVDLGCKCHESARQRQTELAPASELACRGALNIFFPVRMFDGAGELEYTQMRQKFVRDCLSLFDEFYERVRGELQAKDPLIIRPERKGRMLALIDAEALKVLADDGNGQDGNAMIAEPLGEEPDTNEC